MSVTVKDLTISYNRHPAIHHLNGCFETGSLTAVAGPNGAGKSTLLKAIAGIADIDTGEIIFDGIDEHEIAYLPQSAEIQKDFPLTILQLVCTGFWKQAGSFGRITKEMRQQAKVALATVGLSEFEDRNIATLSVGQFQRALFARLILQDAKLILLDEPFAAIDSETTDKLLQIIKQWNAEGRTVICILHDVAQIKQYFPQCLLLARKCIAWADSKTALDPEKLFSARLFHEAWRDNAEPCQGVNKS